jgi:hypothetical protein
MASGSHGVILNGPRRLRQGAPGAPLACVRNVLARRAKSPRGQPVKSGGDGYFVDVTRAADCAVTAALGERACWWTLCMGRFWSFAKSSWKQSHYVRREGMGTRLEGAGSEPLCPLSRQKPGNSLQTLPKFSTISPLNALAWGYDFGFLRRYEGVKARGSHSGEAPRTAPGDGYYRHCCFLTR